MVNAKTWDPAQIDQAIRRLEGIIRSGSYNPAVLNQLLNQLGEPGYINTWNPAELDQKLRTLLHDLLSWKTATGNPIQLRTNNGGLVQSLEVTFSPIQSGTGDPAPDNIRPISGRDSVDIVISDGETEETKTISFPSTIYGGNVEIVGGNGNLLYDIIVLDDSINYIESGEKSFRVYNQLFADGLFNSDPNVCSSWLSKNEAGNTISFRQSGGEGNKNIYLFLMKDLDPSIVDVASFKTYMGQHPLQVCYRKSTPNPFSTTPTSIELNSGDNVISTDGDSIEITYKKLLLPSDVESLSKNKQIKEKPKTTRSKKKKEE